MDCKLLLALPTEDLSNYLETQIRALSSIKCRIQKATDLYSIPETIKEYKPDIVITSPSVVSDPMIPLIKRAGDHNVHFIAFCLSLTDTLLLRYYDSKIHIIDTALEIENVIIETLALDINSMEEQLLTPREKEVVIAVVKGLTNKEIAEEMYLSTHTIITHRRNIARKLNIHSPAGLTIYAILNKLVKLEDIMK